jgi:hypothetical protein
VNESEAERKAGEGHDFQLTGEVPISHSSHTSKKGMQTANLAVTNQRRVWHLVVWAIVLKTGTGVWC